MTARVDKVGIIDVGSNSVRCAVFSCGKPCFKQLITSRLGEGVFNGLLSEAAVERTVNAVCELVALAREQGAESIYVFATEAVRRAKNAEIFTSAVNRRVGLSVDVVDGKTEAQLAIDGALGDGDGCVIDLGGASTEIVVRLRGEIVYAFSVGVGAVVLSDACGRDKSKLTAYIAQKCREFGEVPAANNVVAVGGTATSIAACSLRLSKYDPSVVHGAKLTVQELDRLIGRFGGMTAEQIATEYPVDGRRAEIIFGGAILLKHALLCAGGQSLTVSESDNLEGYYRRLAKGDRENER